jgi:hypothetical protein
MPNQPTTYNVPMSRTTALSLQAAVTAALNGQPGEAYVPLGNLGTCILALSVTD